MKVELFQPESVTEPRHWVRHDQAFAMMLRPGSIEWGSKRTALEKFEYAPGDLALCDRHIGEWVGLMNVTHLQLSISDAALMASSDGAYGEVALRASRKFGNPRLSALVAAAHAEMVAGFPSGRLFMDSVEQAMAVSLVKDHAVRHRPVEMYRGGLGSARLRKIKELVHVKMEDDLSLDEMAQSVGLSTAHFGGCFASQRARPRINSFCVKRLSALKRCCVPLMREYWTWPWLVVSRPSSILPRSFVMFVELARQSIVRIFWTPKSLAIRKLAPKIRQFYRLFLDSQLTCRIDREFLVHSSFHPPQHYRLNQQF